ncbi:unnamed protein product [Spirodela intermedia]|uniref:Uncharacterized protein n=1 Tax=Spirodela intermedia TaxID=51605 RepID=A0ABN7ECX5_SPIIN|nr:unnamed protein product [Spirodela intermedia]
MKCPRIRGELPWEVSDLHLRRLIS